MSYNILVVDSDPNNIAYIRHALSPYHNITIAKTKGDAEKEVRNNSLDVILINTALVGRSGSCTCHAIRGLKSSIKIIGISRHRAHSVRWNQIADGFFHINDNGFSSGTKLERTIEKVLERNL